MLVTGGGQQTGTILMVGYTVFSLWIIGQPIVEV